MAAAISIIRALPRGWRRTSAVSAAAKTTATAAPAMAYRTTLSISLGSLRHSLLVKVRLGLRGWRRARTDRRRDQIPDEVVDRDAGDDVDPAVACLGGVVTGPVEVLLADRKGI